MKLAHVEEWYGFVGILDKEPYADAIKRHPNQFKYISDALAERLTAAMLELDQIQALIDAFPVSERQNK
jgi:hypothetical protein